MTTTTAIAYYYEIKYFAPGRACKHVRRHVRSQNLENHTAKPSAAPHKKWCMFIEAVARFFSSGHVKC